MIQVRDLSVYNWNHRIQCDQLGGHKTEDGRSTKKTNDAGEAREAGRGIQVTSASTMGGTGKPETRGGRQRLESLGETGLGLGNTQRRWWARKSLIRWCQRRSARDRGHQEADKSRDTATAPQSRGRGHWGGERPHPPRKPGAAANAPRRPRGNIIARQKVNYEIRKQ